MQEIKFGDSVLLYLPDGSVTTNIVVNVISLAEVQLINPSISNSFFDASTAPIYKRGTQAGEWEPMNEEPQEDFKRFAEALQLTNHPLARDLVSLLNTKLPPDVEEVFNNIRRIYEGNNIESPFYEVIHRNGRFNNNDYFYNLATMGVQEGLHSVYYFLQQFLYLTELVKVQGAVIVADVKPSHSGALGINAHSLNANYEGFTILSRTTLDRLNSFLKYYFQINKIQINQSRQTRKPNLYELISYLEEKDGENQKVKKLVEIAKEHKTYLDTQFADSGGPSTERNRLVHQEYIDFTTPNIMYSSDGTVRVVLMYGEGLQADAIEELTNRFNGLKLFIIDVLKEFFDTVHV